MAAKIYAAARERLLEVWDYTAKTWGEDQADEYVRGLVSAINAAASEPYSWRPLADKALKGVFFIRYRHHYIFFRELPEATLGVISVLHESMDLPLRLREDFRQGEDQ